MGGGYRPFFVGLAWALGSGIAFGLLTALIPNPLFTRMTVVEWWGYGLYALTSLLLGLFMGLREWSKAKGLGKACAGGALGVFGYSCALCNKLLVALLGLTAVAAYVQPLQPLFGLLGVGLLGLACARELRAIKIPREPRRRTSAARILLAAFFLLLPTAEAVEYSYEHSEELKHLIQWRDYGPQAFEEATAQNKPVFLVLSAVWCYWCHVYESEDYLYHPLVYPYLNEHFIPVFVDADRRQDLRRQYLEGGWPSTTVLGPDGKRLFGFVGPRKPEVLRDALEKTVALMQNRTFSASVPEGYVPAPLLNRTESEVGNYVMGYLKYLLDNFDDEYGDFGFTDKPPAWREGQKFPHGLGLAALMEMTAPANTGRVALTLERQLTPQKNFASDYRLTDPVEGGFHRYSTLRDWSKPHYEKMLDTNARLLFAYARLAARTRNQTHLRAVNQTNAYLLTILQDPGGGFYGSQDASEAYYLLDKVRRRHSEPPHIDRTIYADWNGEAVLALLEAADLFSDGEARQAALRALDRMAGSMVGGHGVSHYLDPAAGEAGVTGNLADNALVLLALLRGYNATGDAKYLSAARRVADYSLDTLYDWNSAGFFERNSEERTLYRPEELFLQDRPYYENGVMARAFLDLYALEGDPEHALVAVETLSAFIGSYGGIDESYWMWSAAKSERLGAARIFYAENPDAIDAIRRQRQRAFFLNRFMPGPPGAALDNPAFTAASILVLAVIAFMAGLLSFLSPCTLPILPAIFAAGTKAPRKRIALHVLGFLVGLAAMFSALGVLLGAAGQHLPRAWIEWAAGLVLVLMGTMTVFGKGFAGPVKAKASPRTLGSSVLFGLSFGAGWSACVGPILVGLLGLAAASGTAAKGGLLLFIYSLGVGVPLLILALWFDRLGPKTRAWRWLRGRTVKIGGASLNSTELISGLFMVAIGFLVMFGVLSAISRLVISSPFQQALFKGEEWIMRILS